MATRISVLARFSDGSFGSFENESVTEGTATEILPGGAGLAKVAGGSAGDTFIGKVMTHGLAKVETADASTGSFCNAYLLAPTGQVLAGIQGGGDHVSGLPALKRPVRMASGIKIYATWDAVADAATLLASVVAYYNDGSADVFTAAGVNNTKTSMTNLQGATWGEAGSGKVVLCAYATFASQYGLNEGNGGNSAFYVESPEGILKMMYSPAKGSGASDIAAPWQEVPVTVNLYDTLSVMASKS